MFGFANRYKLDHLANGVINGISNGDNSGMHHHPAASDDDDHLDDIAYERKARLCNSKSCRALITFSIDKMRESLCTVLLTPIDRISNLWYA
jgi:hypothetical protein